jgi:hypothetical protein
VRELRPEEKAVVGAAVSVAVLLLLVAVPSDYFQALDALSALNGLVAMVAIAVAGGALMTWGFGRLGLGHQLAATLALLAFGVFFRFPAFAALGVVGLGLMVYEWHQIAVRSYKLAGR